VYLKSIELVGFKSFVEPTLLTFEPGITIVVGPNGCGKSNVSDAIRWVLGEQSAKLLRGRRMEDLIFNGSATRAPLGMAEASLVLADVASSLGESPYAVFDEVKVTRRLFRDGTSEYRLNEAPCRLKDIVELFLESGLAANAFAVIEQDQVAAIVSAKPEERRLLLEQAAGVLKYMHKRAIAKRRLDAAGDNLVRVTDLVEELRRQVERLRRQAQRARRYQALSRELRGVELAILAEEFFAAQARAAALDGEVDRDRATVEGRAAELAAREGDLANLRLQGTTLERTVAGRRQERLECEQAIDRAEHRVGVLREEREKLAEQREATDEEVEHLRDAVAKEAERRTALEGKGRELEQSYEAAWALHESLEAAAAEASERLEGAQAALEPAKALLFERMQAESGLSNEATALETRSKALEVRLEQLEAACEADREASERVEAAHQTHTAARSEAARAHDEALRQRAVNVNEMARTVEALHGLDEEIASVRDTLTERKSLLSSLEAIHRSFEGYKEGVRYLMERREESAELAGIRGVLAELLECPPDYEVAIEAALGERVQSLVVESHADARVAIERLRDAAAGRSAFIPIHPEGQGPPDSLPPASGLIGPAVEVVSCRDEFRPVIQHLLGGVWLVEDLDTALEVWRTSGHRATFVTLDGIVMEPTGLLVGGSVNSGHLELLKKRRLVRELADEVVALEKRLAPLEEDRVRHRERREALEADRGALDQRVGELDRRLVEVDKTLEHLAHERERIGRSLEVAAAETARVAAEQEALDSEATSLAERRGQAEADRLEQEAIIAEAERAVAEATASREEARQAVHEQSLAVTRLRGGRDAHQAEQAAANQRLQDLEAHLAETERRREMVTEREGEVHRSLDALEAELQGRFAERAGLVDRLQAAEGELSSHQAQAASVEEVIRQSRDRLEEAKDRMNALEVSRAEVRVEIGHIEDRVRREWRLASAALVAYHDPDGPPLEERRRQADTLRQRLRNLGGVNLEALEEFEEVEARHTFLDAQKADLERSIDDLTKAIEKINRTTRRMLRETFDAVNARFQEVFARLFDGGSASLVLTDVDILEAGVDISVQPPGKRLGSITLLSAGEKALTALALLFAIFLVKPAPFCLLDEVDAALDDANVDRFTSLLKERASETQFIVITHNKQTMVHGEVLFGVTMEEEGVSRIVSLNLEQAASHAR
jgi:chromosome segregation protein